MFKDKKIFILGMARSGYEAAKLLSKYNNEILVTDQKDQDENQLNELKELGVTFIKSTTPEEMLDDSYDYVIKNPGIIHEHPVVLKAESLNIPVINELEMAYDFFPQDLKIIGITGSNGKTTTTTIIYELLKKMGAPVHLGGNIGYPVSSLVNKIKKGDILVLEISGHQLRDMNKFKTDISVMTNLTQVHIDFFHTYENYKNMKTCIFRNHTDKDIAILNLENDDVLEQTKDVPSHKYYFSSKKDADACIKDKAIYVHDEKIIDLDKIKLQGNHNYENIMCALLVTKEFGISNDVIASVLENFGGVEHRIEYVKTLNERVFYNDSKATNVESTQIALNAFKKLTILILGGLDRGHSFEGLTDYLKNTKHIVALGETKHRIKEYAKTVNVPCTLVENIKEAVYEAYALSDKGDVILLSPACASWDQYKSFEERGTDFKNAIINLE